MVAGSKNFRSLPTAPDGVAYALHDEAERQVRAIIESADTSGSESVKLGISIAVLWIPIGSKC